MTPTGVAAKFKAERRPVIENKPVTADNVYLNNKASQQGEQEYLPYIISQRPTVAKRNSIHTEEPAAAAIAISKPASFNLGLLSEPTHLLPPRTKVSDNDYFIGEEDVAQKEGMKQNQ